MLEFTHIEPLDSEDISNLLVLPVANASKYATASKKLDELDFSKVKADKITSLGLAGTGKDILNLKGIFEGRENTSESIIDDEVEIKTSYPTIKNRKNKLSKRRMKSVASKAIGIAGVKQVPLPHSGFWITIDVVPRIDRIVLDNILASKELDIAVTTSTLIYSAPRAMYIRSIVEFLSNFIIDSTLDISDDSDILDYINVLDIDIIILEVLKLSHPKGLDIATSCRNTLSVEDDEVVCGYTISGKISLDAVYQFDYEALSEDQISILSKKTSGSVSMDDFNKYGDEFSNVERKVTNVYEIDDDEKVSITLSASSINRFLELSDTYIEELNLHVDKILMGDTSPIVRKSKLEEISKDMVLAQYIHMIDKITINGETSSELASIYNCLIILMDDTKLISKILTDIIEYTDINLMAMVCTPLYVCPNCKKDNLKDEDKPEDPFDKVVPLDILDVFTELRTK